MSIRDKLENITGPGVAGAMRYWLLLLIFGHTAVAILITLLARDNLPVMLTAILGQLTTVRVQGKLLPLISRREQELLDANSTLAKIIRVVYSTPSVIPVKGPEEVQ